MNDATNGYSCNSSNGLNNGNVPESGQHFLQQLHDLMVKEVFEKSKNRKSRVVEFKHPKELESMLDLSLENPTSDEKLLEICKDVIRYSVKTGLP